MYRPPDNTNVLEYTFKFYQDGYVSGAYQAGCYSVYVDDVPMGQFTIKNFDRGSNANIMEITAVFKIGGGYANGTTPNETHGEFSSWTTTKTIKVIGHIGSTNSNYNVRLFKTNTGWNRPYQQADSEDSDYRIQRPILKLVAMGTKTATSGGSGGGITNFLALQDTPSSFVANKYLAINAAGTGITFADAPSGGGSSGVTSTTLKGQILEYFELPSDGVSTRTVNSGTYTATTTPSGETVLNNSGSWSDIPGTLLEGYTPPEGTSVVYYKCKFLKRKSGELRAGFTIKIKDDNSGSTEIIAPLSGGSTTYGTSTRPAIEMNWDSSFEMIEVYGSIKIGQDYKTSGSPQLQYGELASWTTPKTISTVFCSYSSTYSGLRVNYHDIQPLITLIAVGDREVTSGGGSGTMISANQIDFSGLPTSNPGVVGKLWNDNGIMKISSG